MHDFAFEFSRKKDPTEDPSNMNTVRLLPFIRFVLFIIFQFLFSLRKLYVKVEKFVSCAHVSYSNFLFVFYIRTGELFETFHTSVE